MNFVLFYPETLRADAAIDKGIPAARTPTFDSLGEEGVVFSNAFTQNPFCTPSRCSMFTGTYPHVRGHRSLMHLLHPGERNLFQDLKEAGYETVCFGKNDLVCGEAIPASFDIYKPFVAPEPSRPLVNPEYDDPEHKYYGAFYRGSLGNGPNHDRDWACVESALQFIDRDHEKPFCLFLPLSYAHPPYQAEEPFFSMHDPDDMPEPAPRVEEDRRGGFEMLRKSRGLDRLDARDLKMIRATYYGMISRLDHQLGLIVDRLQARGLTDDTAVFMFSDHGDYAGDYGQVEKWNYGFDDCLLNVPLIARIPGYPAVGGCDDLIEMVDIYPTILELASVEPASYHMGRSLAPIMRGAPGAAGAAARTEVFAETGWNLDEAHCFTPANIAVGRYAKTSQATRKNPQFCTRAASVRTMDYKYVFSPDERDELFDLRTDPWCTRNVVDSADMEPVRRDLQARLLGWYLRTSDATPLEPDDRGFPS